MKKSVRESEHSKILDGGKSEDVRLTAKNTTPFNTMVAIAVRQYNISRRTGTSMP
jgi:hypothetical protein